MIERIIWPSRDDNPFIDKTGARPLRITFHTHSFSNLSPEDTEALEAIKDLANLSHNIVEAPKFIIFQTEPGEFPHIQLGSINNNIMKVYVKTFAGGEHHTGIFYANQYLQIASDLSGKPSSDSETENILNDLYFARAHHELQQDIFVTTSPQLLSIHSQPGLIGVANSRSPSEAAQIVGLLFRSYECYILNSPISYENSLYWHLARRKTDSLWRYNDSCLKFLGQNTGDTLNLALSIIVRVVRALETRDKIAEIFYARQDSKKSNQLMYYFDYIPLLLAGAFDTQSHVTYRLYSHLMNGVEEYSAGFQNKIDKTTQLPTRKQPLVNKLQNPVSQKLYRFVTQDRFQAIATMLYQLRNTIHGAVLSGAHSQSFGNPNMEFKIMIHKHKNETIFRVMYNSLQILGGFERYGVVYQQYDEVLESGEKIPREQMSVMPYKFTTILIEDCIDLINGIADATDFLALSPTLFPIDPPISTGRPIPIDIHDPFNEHLGKRLMALG
jgi:hypothetical protein